MLDPQPKRVGGKTCGNCAATTSPQWRTGGLDGRLLCNRCGLYYARHKRHRPLTTDSAPEEGVGRVSNVRRKQLELCLQHAARRQRDAELYYQRLAAAHAHAAARYASGPPFNQALGPHTSAPAFHLHAGHAASTPAPGTTVPRSPGDVEREIQQHLDRAHQLLMQFHAHPDGSPPPPPTICSRRTRCPWFFSARWTSSCSTRRPARQRSWSGTAAPPPSAPFPPPPTSRTSATPSAPRS
eukprot:TRINITY_DN16465_c0_g1_i1.p1 TRINITY_DN16465_c0_g1~~TRINITY_DN16465_c0_g1_i1.p1  ORF type:complete len:254 (+),score=28.34 TRINITY_DN16465_c0_g1_i1:45-764(+)